jgi:hypothetical protein
VPSRGVNYTVWPNTPAVNVISDDYMDLYKWCSSEHHNPYLEKVEINARSFPLKPQFA